MVRASAPIRVGDCGGWTDTWFAGSGRVFNVAVSPGIEVTLAAGTGEMSPLLAAAMRRVPPPEPCQLRVDAQVPPGAGTGTSAAVLVAALAALHHLRGAPLSPAALAREAFQIEVDDLGRQSGVQDQLSAAWGGALDIEIGPYPEARVRPLLTPESLRREWDSLACLVLFESGHDSSRLHQQVIQQLEADRSPVLQELQDCAAQAVQAWECRDLAALGQAMSANTRAQARLAPGLVTPQHLHVIEAAEPCGTLGAKVNGAGGNGASMLLLCPDQERLKEGLKAIPGAKLLPVCFAPGGAVAAFESNL